MDSECSSLYMDSDKHRKFWGIAYLQNTRRGEGVSSVATTYRCHDDCWVCIRISFHQIRFLECLIRPYGNECHNSAFFLCTPLCVPALQTVRGDSVGFICESPGVT